MPANALLPSCRTMRKTPPEERAERLRVLVEVAPYLPLHPAEAAEFLTAEDGELIQRITVQDLELVNACLEVESDVRRKQFAAVEELTALVTAGEGSLDDRVAALPRAERFAAIGAIIAAGWVDR